MLKIYYTRDSGWGAPRITPLQDLRLHPAAKVLHYSVELFEGMKAFRGVDDEIRLFRPGMNMARMNRTAARSALPTFDSEELITLLKKLVNVDQEWVPHTESSSLYIRPTLIGTEPTLGVVRPAEALLFVILSPVGPYFASGFKPVSLLADPRFVRAWPGGVGEMKMGANYGPTLEIQRQAEKRGLQQVLWLFGPDHRITEVGAMNIMVYLVNESGEKELVTPPLDGLILPGVTRDSLLTLGRQWGEYKVSERDITMGELEQANQEGRLLEMFGAGTAAVVTPVGEIHYQDRVIKVPTEGTDGGVSLAQRYYDTITGIQYGKIPSDWAVKLDS
ncbi:branched-chain-amino-acid aminotransferase, cytosolic-like [Eriocheir sinensis]|uniref:branched-chain-amino-acid aminotransferase, cytosolic-like n=1 Tax=Eriocheir sinensis TaxID=95602 RepID=UPI0021CAA671|nr:branched-chain-amino-acid aminotransferase, cytosolic-like [Eriocheir sinensis]XP_050732143.1 branched-chain-amino-acid aminotransferase, cytosolic-like [Eriocheir sinensis]XP_050732145.1 branched-chain-amino-acid aminotransferase, cytosolic-like [Eriocheir sinensis]XP_050732146.1 branched-chain-amino-acid aminotransferase, cytosolic-like [Eriocheir sinensis]XP_050732147.1 branched-chain-amino-acid aminotransferase, cytosolic-like [Eriocheir sinensis]XP_050732148.1 branched-chain-amino-acid